MRTLFKCEQRLSHSVPSHGCKKMVHLYPSKWSVLVLSERHKAWPVIVMKLMSANTHHLTPIVLNYVRSFFTVSQKTQLIGCPWSMNSTRTPCLSQNMIFLLKLCVCIFFLMCSKSDMLQDTHVSPLLTVWLSILNPSSWKHVKNYKARATYLPFLVLCGHLWHPTHTNSAETQIISHNVIESLKYLRSAWRENLWNTFFSFFCSQNMSSQTFPLNHMIHNLPTTVAQSSCSLFSPSLNILT